ncbi:hypothetical protein [Paraburkholderia sp. J10-1]|uniref:hypothetical protein n=1 Tax=Paraburkholderia sp. J10-1 TaxID=2805430 RepID=UPI002AB786BB|nr:hypothetical protein [Paraburkholderia sp. J10-1]
MRKYWEVSIRWNDNNSEEGTFTESVFADDDVQAQRLVAESMACSDDSEIDPDDEGEFAEFVASALQRVDSVSEVGKSLPDDIESVFFDELFPDGQRRSINMNALAALLAEHRDRVLTPARG